jgi:DNA modification methylase
VASIPLRNNYDYNKAVWLMSEFDFLENGFFMLKEDTGFSAPISCAYYSYYDTAQEVIDEIENQKEAIQCVISKLDIENSIPLGEAQQPNLWDYADGIDTLEFLNNL